MNSKWSELIATLQQWPWMQTYHTLRQRFREDRLGLTAGSLTFTTTIALVPLVTVMLALFSAFPVFMKVRRAVEQEFITAWVPEAIAKQVMLSMGKFTGKASQLGSVGMVALGVTAMALMLTIDHTLNNIWRVKRVRPIAQRVLIYWAALTLGPLMLGASLSVTSYLLSASKGWVDAVPGGLGFLLGLVVFCMQAAGFAALYKYVPNTHVRWEHAIAGALFATGGLELAQRVLALYLSKVPVYATIYGAFAAVPIFLIWIYVSWLIILMGAVVAAYAPSLLSRVKRWPDTPGHRFQLSLAVLKALWTAQTQGERGLSAERLAQQLRTDPLQIEPMLELLLDLDWIGLLDEPESTGGGRYVLLCDPDDTLMAPLVGRVLLTPDGFTMGFWSAARMDEVTLRQALS